MRTRSEDGRERPARSWPGRLAAAAVVAVFGLTGPAAADDPAPAPLPAAATCDLGKSLLPAMRADGRLARVEAEAAKTPHGEGRFWRIEKEGRPTSYLFGTMHLSDARILTLPDAVEEARAKADTVVIELLDILDETKATFGVFAYPDLVNLPAGKSLDDYLSPDEKREVEALLAERKIPYDSIRTLQPWFFSVGLMLPACETARALLGLKPLDVQLAFDAKAAGKTVAGLETMNEQMRAMASMRMELQTASLIAVLKLHGQLPDLFETMIELYLADKVAAITPLSDSVMPVDEMPPAVQEAYKAFEKTIVTERNHRMAERLKPFLEKGGAFVAVGALHLVGEEGLVELLSKDGYRLTRPD